MLYSLSLLETEEQKDRFMEIYDRNKDRMYHIAFRFLGQKEEAAMEKEQAELIRQLLKELSGIYHDILVLRYYCDLSVKEIAQILGISKKTAETRLYRAKERLREVLYENGIQHVGNAG